MANLEYVIGADIGGGSARVAGVSAAGSVIKKLILPSDPASGYHALVERVRRAINAIIAGAKSPPSAMCVACAGAVDFKNNVIISSPNFPGWARVPLARDLGKGFSFPVILENDANAAALGEGWIGSARGWPSFAMFTLGTGVGGGIVIEGSVFRGPNGMAGEVGHLPFSREGLMCGCGRRGCLETTASAGGVARSARAILDKPEGSALRRSCRGNPGGVDARMVARLAAKGDKACLAIMKGAGGELGEAMGALCLAMGLSRFVIGGGMAGAFDILRAPMRKAALARAYTLHSRDLRLVKAGLGDNAGLLGAARLALTLR